MPSPRKQIDHPALRATLRRAPLAALVAAGLLLVELAVQIPFVGLDPLQAVMGTVALAMLTLAWLARRAAVR